MNGKIPALLFFAYKRVEDVILPVAKETFEIHIFRENRIGIKFHSILPCIDNHCFMPLSDHIYIILNIYLHNESFNYCRQTITLFISSVILKYLRHYWIVFTLFSPFHILPILHIPYVPKILQSFKRATSNLSRSLFS